MYKKIITICSLLALHSVATAMENRSLTEQILALHRPITSPHGGGSTILANGAGLVRRYPNGTIIQLKGKSQESNMGCGFSAYANARILQSARDAKTLITDLNNEPIIRRHIQDLETQLPRNPHSITELKNQRGLALDEIFGVNNVVVNGIVLGNEGPRKDFGPRPVSYHLFPNEQMTQQWHHDYEGFSEIIRTYSFANPAMPKQLPCTCIVNIGSTGGHYIAVRLERLSDNTFGIIFVDSVQYSEGQFVDKIEAYKQFFTQWLQEMPRYFNMRQNQVQPQQPTPQPMPAAPSKHESLPAANSTTSTSIFGDLGPVLLTDLIDHVIHGNSERATNEALDLLKAQVNQFTSIKSLQLTENKNQNYNNRRDLIVALAQKHPEALQTITDYLFNTLTDQSQNWQPDDRKLAEELVNSLV